VPCAITTRSAREAARPTAMLRCEDAVGSASSVPVEHGKHSGHREEAADSPWTHDDGEAIEWGGAAVLQWRWGITMIAGDLGWLQHHIWNRREVSISSIERILRSVGRSLNVGGNDGARPKIRWGWRFRWACGGGTCMGSREEGQDRRRQRKSRVKRWRTRARR
jgi:hypothetical protein